MVMCDFFSQLIQSDVGNTLFQLTLPYDNDIPTLTFQNLIVLFIAAYIGLYFLFPEFCVTFWPDKIFAAFMLMPETTVYKNYVSVFWKDNIRLSRIAGIIFSVPESAGEKILPYDFLRFGIFAADSGHIVASGFFGMIICHMLHRKVKIIDTFALQRYINCISTIPNEICHCNSLSFRDSQTFA